MDPSVVPRPPLIARVAGPGPATAALAGGGELHLAILLGDLEACWAILDHGPFSALRARDVHGRSVLHIAAACGYADLSAAILRHPEFGQASATLLDHNGCSAYMLAPPEVRSAFEVVQAVSSATSSSEPFSSMRPFESYCERWQ